MISYNKRLNMNVSRETFIFNLFNYISCNMFIHRKYTIHVQLNMT